MNYMTITEEAMEMIGQIIFVHALLSYLSGLIGGVQFEFARDRPRPAAPDPPPGKAPG
jgi:hypothetical protein